MSHIYTFIGIYIISAFIIWLWYYIAYGKHGKYANQSMSESEKTGTMVSIFMPIVNTLFILGWVESPYPPKPKIYKTPKPARNRSFADFILRLNRTK